MISEQAIEQTVELQEILDALMLIWRHSTVAEFINENTVFSRVNLVYMQRQLWIIYE